MIKNLMKEKLIKGDVAVGVVIQEPAIQITEILGLIGFDWLFIDCENSPMSIESVAQLVRAAELRGISPIVRPPQNIPEVIAIYMDIGAVGIVVAGLDSALEAQNAVRAVKYPPEGERGLSPIRASNYGLIELLGEYVKIANLETIVMGVIESKEGVDHIDEICGIENLDAVIIGTYDLSQALGVPGQTAHPLVLEAITKILLAGEKAGIPVGGAIRGDETPSQYVDKGFRIILTSVSGLIVSAGKKFLKNARI